MEQSRRMFLIALAFSLHLTSAQDAGTTLGDFVNQLTSLISQNGGIGTLVNAVRPPGQYPGQVLSAGDDGYGLNPSKPYYPPHYPEKYPEYAPQYPGHYSGYPPDRPSPYPPSYQSEYPEDYRPGRPPYPQNYAPGYNPYRPQPGYPQQSFMAALDSITRHDELRCVPRLLCEVTSGGKPGYPSSDSNQQQTIKDTITNLLTVLNFMDNNPLFVFGRAALLGAASRGNSAACLNAYPTCPRDPDRLVHYLNNHNGGFFRFFSGLPSQGRDQSILPLDEEARIQNKPGRALSFPTAVRPIEPQDYLPPSAHSSSDRFVFPESPTRGGKQLHFPDESDSFPERPSYNPGSAYKPDYSPPQNLINFRDQRSVKFPAPMNFPKI
ncbi:uncharacterized protein [Halyomorpha halys]|uniref:uncharacterized protein n=1 Tax=Halyomorpha halys TaxID=286706 RepID=UPI0006D4D6F5|nr:adhesive plaque matrix protein [Halyomorpha halys]